MGLFFNFSDMDDDDPISIEKHTPFTTDEKREAKLTPEENEILCVLQKPVITFEKLRNYIMMNGAPYGII